MSFVKPLVIFSVISSWNGCNPEYTLHPRWEPSILERLGCDEEADAAATPEERPVAACEATVPELVPIHESTSFDGTGSYDPNGNPLIDYHWRLLERPEGSSARMPGGQAVRWGFVPDVAGQYVAELIVTNDQCVMSEPCQAVVNARPSQDLWVEMFWEHRGDDMDLHLVQAGASYTSDGDCYYGNCVGGGPEWGDPGRWEDDPFLDLDDIDGTGPENINVAEPAPGLYRVVVHDYPGSTFRGDNDVTVRIYADGELAFEETRTISGEDLYVPFAEVSWPEGLVRPL